MITARLAEVSELDVLLKIMEPYTSIYGIDTVSTGWKQTHINFVTNALENPKWIPNWNVVVAVDENDIILGFCLQLIYPNHYKWLLKLTYISEKENINQYNASKIGGVMLDKLVELAEEKGKFEFYYVVRDSGTKRLNMTLSNTKIVAEKYHIYNYLVLPPFTPSTDKGVVNMLGHVNGNNTKTIIIRHGHLKGLYNHE
jgi:hypothetical protein